MIQHTEQTSPKIVVSLNERPIRVLHVDDEPGFLKIAKQCLEMQGQFQVDTASCVEEAFEKLKKEQYDAIISDYQMPGMDGLEFLKELRQGGSCVSFIMFTGKGREEVAVDAWKLGADYYVNKSGDPETVFYELAHCLLSTMERQRARTQTREIAQKLQAICQNAVEGISYVDQEENLLYVNKAFADTLGCKEEELVGTNLRRFVDEENWAKVRIETDNRQKGRANRYELVLHRPDGTTRNVQVSASPLFNSDGDFTGTAAIILDITERKKAEESLRESEERFYRLSAATFEGIGLSEKGKIIDVNDQLAKMLGHKPDELIGRDVLDIVALESRDLVMANMHTECSGPYEHLALRKDGSTFPVEIRARSIQYHGRMARVTAISDITERKNTEQELRRFSSAIKASLDGIITGDLKGNITDINEAALRIYGSDDKYDLIGRNVQDLLVERDRTKAFQNAIETVQTRQGKTVEYTALKKSGVEVPIEVTTQLVVDEKGEPIGFVDVVRDLTERKKAEEHTRKTAEEFYRIFQTISDLVFIIDSDNKIVRVNKKICDVLKKKSEELVGKHCYEVMHGTDEPWPDCPHLRALKAKRTVSGEVDDPHLGIPLSVTVSPILDEKGEFVQCLHTAKDITERKRNEKTILENQKKFEALFHGNPEATVFVDVGMHIMDVNDRFTGLFGYSLDEIKGKHINDVVVPRNLLEEGRMLDTQATDGYVYHNTVRKAKNGSLIPVSISAAPLSIQDQLTGYVWLYKDISRQKAAEGSLKESEERFKALFAGCPEAVVYLASDFRILDVNPRFEELFGNSLSEIKGKCIDDVIVPENMIDEAKMLDKKAVEGYVYHDTLRMKKDGSIIHVSISAAPILILDKLVGYIGVYKDISDLKKTERNLAIMNEKLRVVGGLTRHDVRNKLSGITGNAYLLKKQLAGDQNALDKLRDMETAVEQTGRILDFAKTYEMLGVEELVYIDVEKTVTQAISLFSDLKDVKVTNDCHGLLVLADSLLRQLFYNLIDNSLKYGQKITTIRVSFEKTDQLQLKLFYNDDGVGIPASTKPQLFKEGYTTGGSTGYGLYLIKKMIEVYGWNIMETGELGKGVRFVLTIPHLNSNGKENYQLL